MEMLLSLWLPILVSAVVVWIASAMAWMVLPHHGNDWKGLPDEAGFFEALRALKIGPGQYGFPHVADRKQRNDPEFAKRCEAGPKGVLNVWPEKISMGRNMVLSFLFYLVVGVFVAYLGSIALPRGASFAKVFQLVGTAGIMAYTFASIPTAIWFNKPAPNVLSDLGDGVAYGLLTGAVFGVLWPGA